MTRNQQTIVAVMIMTWACAVAYFGITGTINNKRVAAVCSEKGGVIIKLNGDMVCAKVEVLK